VKIEDTKSLGGVEPIIVSPEKVLKIKRSQIGGPTLV
jgi:hypothetical protein